MIKHIQENAEKLSILVVEDNPGDFVLIEDCLYEEFKAIRIVHHTQYGSALKYLEHNKEECSLILLDLNLPDKNGVELVDCILNHNFRVPVIILTGYADLDMAKKSLQKGVYDYLIKDEISPVLLHKTIIFALNRSRFIHLIDDQKNNYEKLFNFSPQPTWVIDESSLKIQNANFAAQNIYGFALQDFCELTFSQLHPIEEEKLVEQVLQSKVQQATQDHFTHVLNDGHEIKVDLYFKQINGNSTNGLIVQANDISESLQYIETIEKQNKKLKNIAWTQSHVVRAPLSRMLGIMNLIDEQKESLENLPFWLNQLKISANEMDEIVKKIVQETNHLN